MKPKAITFDCAGTLVDVKWDSAGLAVQCAQDAGLVFDEGDARARYERKLMGRWGHYRQLNASRDLVACEAFWVELTSDWLSELNLPVEKTNELVSRAQVKLYGPDSQIFRLFDDTLQGIEAAKEQGYRIAVLSNWDYTLTRVLQMLDLHRHFEEVVISLLEGVEKPDPQLFFIAAEKLGLQPSEMVHVGDCPNDDIQGSRNAGIRGILIDRSRSEASDGCVTSLVQVPKVIECV